MDKLLELYSKDITEYTREDFLEGTEPYEYLYLYIDEPFVMEQKRLKIDAVARKCGIRNFSKMFKDYCKKKGRNVVGLNVTDFSMQPLTLRCGNYTCDDSGVKLDMETVCPHPIMPVRRLIDIDTGIEKIEIAFKSFGYGWRKNVLDRKTVFSANKITELSELGVSVSSESAKNLVKYFAKMEELNGDVIEITECVSHLGWLNRNLNDDEKEQLRFVPYEKNIAFDGEGKYSKFYHSVKCKGNFDKWVKLIDEKVRKNKSIIPRIVFAASLSSVLLKPLGCLPFFVHLWGGSGTGKTVATMCAASIWANPTMGEFIQTFGATFVGMERSAAFFNNLPLFLDELQIKDNQKDFDREVYMLTEGVGKTRGNKTGGLDLTPTWRNCTITTGERPILHSSSGGGAANRVIEVECKGRFFGNSDEAKATAMFLENNYGFFGKAFIANLCNSGFEHANELFDKYCSELSTVYDISQKQAASAAAILTADELATEMLFSDTPSLTPKEISDFLKTEASISMGPRAYEYVCEYVAANQNRFTGSAEYGEVWGVMDGSSVYILKNKFNLICEEGGYNSQSLLSWLSDRGLIRRTDKKHFDVLKRIGNTRVRCIHLTLNDGEDEDYSDIEF